MKPEDRYREAAVHALAGFQLIEESLKSYVEHYHETVRKLLPAEIAYRHSRADIQDAALGKLVNVFSKINSNASLVVRLRALVKDRDDLAHKAFAHLYAKLPPAAELELRATAFLGTSQTIGALLTEVHAESLKVLVGKRKVSK